MLQAPWFERTGAKREGSVQQFEAFSMLALA